MICADEKALGALSAEAGLTPLGEYGAFADETGRSGTRTRRVLLGPRQSRCRHDRGGATDQQRIRIGGGLAQHLEGA